MAFQKNGLLKRILKKPPNVVFFRGMQTLNLKWMEKTNAWQRFSKKAALFSVESLKNIKPLIVFPERPYLSNIQEKKLKTLAQDVRSSNFFIFSHSVPNLDNCSFSYDWRFNYDWKQQYFKKYNFYEEKCEAYDVKFPWELSRLHYLVPVFALQWFSHKDIGTLNWLYQLLSRWRKENPLAYSVNWYPMEASMRTISLALMLDFTTLLAKDASKDHIEVISKLENLLIKMLKEHGFFVWKNREFTDIRGNHFTANLVALFLAAAMLEPRGFHKKRWLNYSIKWLDKDIFLQFLPDGVNFEKSCGYHKLVLELFTIVAIARKRLDVPFSKKASARLVEAARFSDALTRPDGYSANFGDNDDAVALPFCFTKPRSHGGVVELARAFFNADIGNCIFDEEDSLTSLFFLGRSKAISKMSSNNEVLNFPYGGYVVVRCQDKGFFCMIDVGEVGMSGRGGHGHNDLLSFELCISGQPVVIDPGCSGYTADLNKKNYYRKTSSHATVEIFNEEMARFGGHWIIHDDAQPLEVSVSEKSGFVRICAGHNGYERIAHNTRIFRVLEVNPEAQKVMITDEIRVPLNNVKIRWSFPLGALPVLSKKKLLLGSETPVVFFAELPVEIGDSFFSCGYGHESLGHVIKAETEVPAGCHRYRFEFHKANG